MEYINVKQTDLQASTIALGCMRIADKSESEIESLIATALDAGINFFDHADIYGGGKSETLFGDVLKKHPEYREKMIIQDKCGIVPGKYYDASYEHIIDSVNHSLERLQTSYIDILLLHRPDALSEPQEIARAFNALHQQGKVKYFGVSNYTAGQIAYLQKYLDFPLVINQLQLSIIHSLMIDSGLNMNMTDEQAIDREGGILDYCRIHDMTIQPWSSVQASWADGTFIDNPKYEKLNTVLATLAEKYHTNKGAIAIAWLLRIPGDIQPILGTTSPVHLKESLDALNIKLTREEWYALYLAEEKPLP